VTARALRSGVSVDRALASSTRASIFQHLRQVATARTVREVAAAFQLHPNVARTHLELLAQAGLVVVGSVKRPGGGRPAKVYVAREEVDAEQGALDAASQQNGAASALVVRLLVTLLNAGRAGSPPGLGVNGGGNGLSLTRHAHEAAAAEGRRLVRGVQGQNTGGGNAPVTLESAARLVVRALRSHAPDAKVARAGRDWVELIGVHTAVELVDRVDPALAEALERGLLTGGFAAAGLTVALTDAGAVPGGARGWRVEVSAQTSSRADVVPAGTVDCRGQQRETGVVHAMRAVTTLGPGEVLEVLAEGPGSPAAFARWADRAGHELLGVERATDLAGRPAIRLLIRKGS
jgi:TusA-related sulfurtransferase/DNA-binding transcriptional ArsR family regulator